MSNPTCPECGVIINPDTAEGTGGLCESWFELILDAAEAATEEAQAEPSMSLSLKQYLALLDGAPTPTPEQRENFVEYVSHAHSWYKHLPLYPPGCPFYFFLDKYAGCDRVRAPDGRAIMVERTEQGFHYSAIPTEEYRARFGYLAYSCDAGTTVVLASPRPIVVPRDKIAAIERDDARKVGLPPEILDAGVVQLTGVIHACSLGMPALWVGGWINRGHSDWPEESGGKCTRQKILERCCRVSGFEKTPYEKQFNDNLFETHPDLAKHTVWVDPVLYELAEPERRRQRTEMRKAIDRVCEIVGSRRMD